MNAYSFSIIVNNFNYGRFLKDAIDSALAQTYGNCEVIVVDDGSTDDSRQVIESYRGRIRSIYKENGGQASALNAGFTASAGEIVMFLDADDRLYPEAASTVASLWRRGLAKIQFPLDYISGTGEQIGRTTTIYRITTVQAREALVRGPLFLSSPTSGNAYSRAMLAKIFPIPEQPYRTCADGYVSAICPFIGEILSLEGALGQMRIHGSNSVSFAGFGAKQLHDALAGGREIYRVLSESLHQKLPAFEDWIATSPSYWLDRLRSARCGCHEEREVKVWRIALGALKTNLAHRPYRRRKRLLLALWILGMACPPRGMAETLLNISVSIGQRANRSVNLRWLLGSVDRVEDLS